MNYKPINAAKQTCIIAETNTKYKSNSNANDKSKQDFKIRHNTNQEEVKRNHNKNKNNMDCAHKPNYQGDQSIIKITNIDILTQLSNDESDTESKDDEFNTKNGYSKGSYRDYEIKVKKAKQCIQRYATHEEGEDNADNSSDDSSSYSTLVKNRQMEPLYIGDVIKYHDISMGLDQFQIKTGLVESIDRQNRIIQIHNGDVLSSINIMKRYIVYDEMSNTMIQQNGIQRYVDDFDLINTRPDVNKFTIASFKDDIANILKKTQTN